MTDEQPGMAEPAEPEGMSTAPAPGPASGMASGGFTSSEGMVSLAGAILIGVYLLTGVIMNDYWISWLPLLLAIFAVVLPRLDRSFVEKFAPLPSIMKALGYTLVILGVLALIEDLRFSGSTFDEFGGVLGALAAYAAYALALLGARGIKT